MNFRSIGLRYLEKKNLNAKANVNKYIVSYGDDVAARLEAFWLRHERKVKGGAVASLQDKSDSAYESIGDAVARVVEGGDFAAAGSEDEDSLIRFDLVEDEEDEDE